jgi:hypothetical protein
VVATVEQVAEQRRLALVAGGGVNQFDYVGDERFRYLS